MSEHERQKLTYRRNFQRRLSLLTLFLLFAGSLLSGINPSHEMEEMLGFDLDGLTATAASSENPTSYVVASSSQRSDNPMNSEGDDDDCLCWCGQVLAAQSFEMASPSVNLVLNESDDSSIPPAPPQVLFHPPRVA